MGLNHYYYSKWKEPKSFMHNVKFFWRSNPHCFRRCSKGRCNKASKETWRGAVHRVWNGVRLWGRFIQLSLYKCTAVMAQTTLCVLHCIHVCSGPEVKKWTARIREAMLLHGSLKMKNGIFQSKRNSTKWTAVYFIKECNSWKELNSEDYHWIYTFPLLPTGVVYLKRGEDTLCGRLSRLGQHLCIL